MSIGLQRILREPYCSGQVTLELFGNHGETSTGLIEQVPTLPHRWSVVERGAKLLLFCDISRIVVPDFVVEHASKLGLNGSATVT